jgi:hypothetical protein
MTKIKEKRRKNTNDVPLHELVEKEKEAQILPQNFHKVLRKKNS